MECAAQLTGAVSIGGSAAVSLTGKNRQNGAVVLRSTVYVTLAAVAADIPLALLGVRDIVLLGVLVGAAVLSLTVSALSRVCLTWQVRDGVLCVRRSGIRCREVTVPISSVHEVCISSCPVCALTKTVIVKIRLGVYCGAGVKLLLGVRTAHKLTSLLPKPANPRRVHSAGRDALLSTRGVSVSRGVLFRHTHRISAANVCAVETRRTLLTNLLGKRTCRLIVPGAGVTVMCRKAQRRVRIELATLFPREGELARVCVAERDRWLYSAFWFAVLLCVCCVWMKSAFAGRGCDTVPAAICAAAVPIWRAVLCVMAGRSACVCVDDRWVSITGVSGFFLRELRIPRSRIARVKLVRLPFVGIQPLCAVYIRPSGIRWGIWCCALPEKRACAIIERIR